jgi:hypothetical protein
MACKLLDKALGGTLVEDREDLKSLMFMQQSNNDLNEIS